MGAPIPDESADGAKIDTKIEEEDESRRNELVAISRSRELAPPVQTLSRAVTPELAPDSMASRMLGDQHGGFLEQVLGEVSFDKMGSRIVVV